MLIFCLLILTFPAAAQEGPCRLMIRTADGLPGNLLRKYTAVEYAGPEEVRGALQKILLDCYREGYLGASFDSVTASEDRVVARFHLGACYRWDQLAIENGSDFPGRFKPGTPKLTNRPVNPDQFRDIGNQILYDLANKGYPFASMKFTNVRIDDGRVKAGLCIDPFEKYVIDSLIVKGDVNISRRFLSRYLGIPPGSPYNEEKISGIGKMIGNLGFITEIKPAELEFAQGRTRIYTYLKNRRTNRFNGVLGMLPGSKGEPLKITGDMNLRLRNVLGYGEGADLHWSRSEKAVQELETGLSWPFLFSSAVGLEVRMNMFRQDSSFLNLNPWAGFQFYFKGLNRLSAFVERESSVMISAALSSGGPGDQEFSGYRTTLYGLSLDLLQRDDPVRPVRGYEIHARIGMGKKRTQLSGDTGSGRKSNKVKSEGGFSIYFPVGRRTVFQLSNETGWQSASNIFRNEMYRLGGMGSLRGFDEKSLFATFFTIFHLEWHYLLEKYSSFFVFTDMGYYQRDEQVGAVAGHPAGFGAGMSLETRAGIFSLSYALGKPTGTTVAWKRAKIHLGYISRF